MTTTTIRSYPAIAGGVLAAGFAWFTITRGRSFAELTLEDAQAAGLIGLSVLSCHLAGQARIRKHRIAALALLVASFVGSILTIYNGMGTRAEYRDVKVATAELSFSERSRIEADLIKTSKLVDQAITWQAESCRKDRTTDKCRGDTFILNQRKASQEALQGKLATTKPTTVAEPKAAQAGLLAGLMGYNAQLVQSIASTLEPVAAPLFFELLAILMFVVGLGHREVPVTVPAKIEAANDVEPLPPKIAPIEAMPTHSEVVEWREAFIAKHGRAPRGRELQMVFLSVPKVTAHRWATGANEPREGREVRRIRAA